MRRWNLSWTLKVGYVWKGRTCGDGHLGGQERGPQAAHVQPGLWLERVSTTSQKDMKMDGWRKCRLFCIRLCKAQSSWLCLCNRNYIQAVFQDDPQLWELLSKFMKMSVRKKRMYSFHIFYAKISSSFNSAFHEFFQVWVYFVFLCFIFFYIFILFL